MELVIQRDKLESSTERQRRTGKEEEEERRREWREKEQVLETKTLGEVKQSEFFSGRRQTEMSQTVKSLKESK